jgi:hypothetical protein
VDAESIVAGWKRRLIALSENPGSGYQELLSPPDPVLPRAAVVFRFHQRRWFSYVLATGGFDSPTVQWDALLHEATHVATGFAAAVDAHLRDVERRTRERHERGGEIRTVRSARAQSTAAAPAPVRDEPSRNHVVDSPADLPGPLGH